MLPPRLASVCFVDPVLGSDSALAARAATAAPGARLLLLGSSRPGLVRSLLSADLDVVVVDSSRTALRRARDELGPDAGVLLLAADPRELEVPGGFDAALVPSAVWRAVLLDADRRHVLRGIAREIRPGGRLLLDLERLPGAPDEPSPLPSGADATWHRDRLAGIVCVEAGDVEVLFSSFSPEEAVREALDEGFTDALLTDARTGQAATAETPVAWACLRARRESG